MNIVNKSAYLVGISRDECPTTDVGTPGDETASSAIDVAARIIAAGGIVAFPTETVYGLGANAFSPDAVARVFEAKGRPRFDPLIVHVATKEQAWSLVAEAPAAALRLAERFWPGPLTLVLPKSGLVPDIVTAGLASVAVRVPNHPIALELIRRAGVPVAAPSANRFGCVSPTSAAHVMEQLGGQVDMVLDGGSCRVGIESTIVGFIDDVPCLLRPGGISRDDIAGVVGRLSEGPSISTRPSAPGQLSRHYAPLTPLRLVEEAQRPPGEGRLGLLAFRAVHHPHSFIATRVLSPSGDLREAAAALFRSVRDLDALGLDMIVAERAPDTGLGVAINDRLSRAAHDRHRTSIIGEQP